MDISEVGYVVDHDVWLTVNEAAEAWGCATQTLYQKKHRDEFPDAFLLESEYNWWIHKDCPRPKTRAKKAKPPQP